MSEKNSLKALAARVHEIAISDEMNRRRDLWRRHNSFLGERPLFHVRAFAADEWFDRSVLKCEDPTLRYYEYQLQQTLWRSELDDDYVIEPWIEMSASYIMPNDQRWGVPITMGEKPVPGGAAAFKPVLLEEDFSCLRASPYIVDEEKTRLRCERLEEALGGALPVFVSRQGPYSLWGGDISTDLAKLRGLEQLMWDVYDNPEWLHSLLSFMRDAILENHRQAETAGGFSLADHQNQCMPYSMELDDPTPSVTGVPLKRFPGGAGVHRFQP